METNQASSQSFCRCGHARSLVMDAEHRHVCGVASCICVRHQTAVKPRPAKLRAVEDSRPRVAYRLPTGDVVAIIFDHGELAPGEVSFQLADGSLVAAVRA